ncbi:hypothetical protein FN976_08415 [Caenimonas sedimenti]|uniref:Porin family protein n=1 Tax=Caenimonas sedimenti TaxID=2596921 RepID=A0A562ZSR7_9BURK|nr:hypothetical protein [Caenimonas sedimenti]TWO71629.1 hypothetical protein FN976_08415 [Caenimonas sedimenti]
MRRAFQILAGTPLLAAALLAAPAAGAQEFAPNYMLTKPTWASAGDPDLAPRLGLMSVGGLHLSTASSDTGAGLSLQAGAQWFARVNVGRSLASDTVSVGGGYRFGDGQALSMHVTRQLGQERLGLAVRYDWTHTYLRLSYDTRTGPAGSPDMLRFQAGMRF